MISEQRSKKKKGGSAMDQRKGSRSPPEHAEMQREHNMKVLASKLEEDLACVSSTTPPSVWYIDSGAC